MSESFKIAVLISGGGTTLQNLIAQREQQNLNAEVVHVVSSSPTAGGNSFATENQIPLTVIERKLYKDDAQFSTAIFDTCTAAQVDLVVMGGFLKRLQIPTEFENKVINIHPSLIPSFSGKGFYGSRVHTAVLNYGCKISGCTVHFVDDQYDHGPIIAQRSLLVGENDSPKSLAARVFDLECQIYPEIINLIALGRIKVQDRKVIISAS